VRYNISQNDRTRGINLAGPVKEQLIYNNTIYVGPEHTVDLLLFSDWHGWTEGTYVYNNIFYVVGAPSFRMEFRALRTALTRRARIGDQQGKCI